MKNRVLVLHGINLGALERRPAEHYGGLTYTQLEHRIARFARELALQASFFQSNHEGEFVEQLHKASDYADGLLLNPGAWTHYAWSLRDALEISGLPAVEVHLSDVDARESFRHVSVLEDVRIGKVAGKGVDGYRDGARAAQGGVRVSRADRVAGRLEDIDALLVTEPANLRYVTGFTGSNGFALVGPNVRRFVTDFRYVEQAKSEVPDFDREQGPQELFAALDGLRRAARLRRRAPVGEGAPAAGRAASTDLVPASGIIEDVRAVKEPSEVEAIAAAAALVDEIYSWLLVVRAGGSHRAFRGGRAGARDAAARRVGTVVSLDRRLGRARRAPARAAARRRDRARHAGHARHRRRAGRLLLGLHAHVGDRRPCPTSWPRSTRWCCARR